jgi:poly-gamma-glutamate synthesis protein (capsule biosynthesis protein)
MLRKLNFSENLCLLIVLFFSISISGCSGSKNPEILRESENDFDSTQVSIVTPSYDSNQVEEKLVSNDSEKLLYWVDPIIQNKPEIIGLSIEKSDFATDKDKANFWFEDKPNSHSEQIFLERFFVLSIPFVNETKNIKFNDLSDVWVKIDSEIPDLHIWVNPDDVEELSKVLGNEPGDLVLISDEMPENCQENNCLRISDFLTVEPTWKVISVDDQSLLSKGFDPLKYPLVYRIWINQNPTLQNKLELPETLEKSSNFDPSKLTSVLVTGTTALVRNTAFQIEEYGYQFPYQNIAGILNDVDLIHVSNEVPFYSECPPAIPVRPEMRFCSNPDYVEVLKGMGVDIVELTGNHLLDWGPEAFLETLEVYKLHGIDYYGGGENNEIAKEPLIIEHNGNKIAFIGCNVTGPENNWATDERPGALRCNLDEMEEIISELKTQDINPIFTFQHFEFNTFKTVSQMQEDFWKMAKAGAVIVSGSQAHYPHGIDFVESSFIHYGLGNFLFDQMYTYWGMATIDIHYFYDNHYINTNQIAIINENYGQPRQMTDEEAKLLLEKLYNYSFYYEKQGQ